MKLEKTIPLGQFLVGFFWVGVAVMVWFGLRSLPPAEAGGLGPATFPKILAVGLMGLAALNWFQSVRAAPLPSPKAQAAGGLLKSIGLSGLALFSALLWEPAGALTVLVLLSIVELRWIEGFSWPRVLAVGLTLSVGMWAIFTQLLGVSLPLGLLLWFY